MLEEGIMHGRAVSGTTSLFILFLLSLDAASSVLARFQWFRSEPSKAQAPVLSCLSSCEWFYLDKWYRVVERGKR